MPTQLSFLDALDPPKAKAPEPAPAPAPFVSALDRLRGENYGWRQLPPEPERERPREAFPAPSWPAPWRAPELAGEAFLLPPDHPRGRLAAGAAWSQWDGAALDVGRRYIAGALERPAAIAAIEELGAGGLEAAAFVDDFVLLTWHVNASAGLLPPARHAAPAWFDPLNPRHWAPFDPRQAEAPAP